MGGLGFLGGLEFPRTPLFTAREGFGTPGDARALPGGVSELPGGVSELPGGASELPEGASELPGSARVLPGGTQESSRKLEKTRKNPRKLENT